MLKINCDTEKGGMSIDEKFSVDFGALENGPYRAHEMRYPGGDCSSDIWMDNSMNGGQFNVNVKKNKKKFTWKNRKWRIILIVVVLVILILIILAIVLLSVFLTKK